MADIKISQLGSAITVDDSDIVPVVSGGNTLKATAAQLKEHAIGNTSISGIGDGSVTGAISALNSDKQPKTLATSITVDGTPQTTVEGALGAINTDLGSTKQALTNETSDIVNILGAKNFLNNATGTKTVRGVTYTLNSDGSITSTGSVESGQSYSYYYINEFLTLPKGKYILSGCPSGGGSNTYSVYLQHGGTGHTDVGNGTWFELSADTICSVLIRVQSGFSGKTFYPMIRPYNIADDSYVPYCMTNAQLTERIAIVEGTTPATTTDSNTIVNFPNGFTRENSMIISIGVYANNNYRYEDKNYGVSAIMTGDNIQVFARETLGCGKDFRLMLMRIV